MKPLKSKKGFSILELMITTSIMLAGVGYMAQMQAGITRNLNNLKASMAEAEFLMAMRNSIVNPVTCTKTFGDYCETLEGEVINPTACKSLGKNWVDNGVDLRDKKIPVKDASIYYQQSKRKTVFEPAKKEKSQGLFSFGNKRRKGKSDGLNNFRKSTVPSMYTIENSAAIERIWVNKYMSIANSCKSMDKVSMIFKDDVETLSGKFALGARLIANALLGNVNAAEAPTTFNGIKSSAKEVVEKFGADKITSGTANAAERFVRPSKGEIPQFIKDAISRNRFNKAKSLRKKNNSGKMKDFNESIFNKRGSKKDQQKEDEVMETEECVRAFNDDVIIKDIRISMESRDPIQHYQESVDEMNPGYKFIVKVKGSMRNHFDDVNRITRGQYYSEYKEVEDSFRCNNPYSELDGEFPTMSHLSVKMARNADGEIVDINKIRPTLVNILVKYYLPNRMGGVHRDHTFTVNAFPLLQETGADTESIKIGKCGIFADSFAENIYDGCANEPYEKPVKTADREFDLENDAATAIISRPKEANALLRSPELLSGVNPVVRNSLTTLPTMAIDGFTIDFNNPVRPFVDPRVNPNPEVLQNSYEEIPTQFHH